jgi:hypothetical protein
MKKLLAFSFLFFFASFSHAQNWQWANHVGGNYMPFSERATVISDGTNSYLIGSFGSILYMPDDTLFSNGNNDMFISKFDQNGQQLWTKQFGGTNSTFMNWEDMNGKFDSVNNCIYLSGEFCGVAMFDTAGTIYSTGTSNDIFLAKMDLNGNVLWVKKAGGADEDHSRVYIGSNGEIYLVCQCLASAYFGNFQVAPGGIIAKYDTNGNCTMAQTKFTVPPSGAHLYMEFIGEDLLFYGNFDTPTFQFDTLTLINKGQSDYFIALCDSNINVKWIKHFGSTGNEFKGELAVDNSGNIYAPIHFSDSLKIDSLVFISAASTNILLLKIFSDGTFLNAKQISATGPIYSICSFTNLNNEFYIGGSFNGQTNFGGNITYTSGLPYDFYIAKFDSTFSLIGSDNFNNAMANDLTFDSFGGIICVGSFMNQVSFGSNNFSSYGGWDFFMAKHDAITGLSVARRESNNQLLIRSNPNAGKCFISIPDELQFDKNLTLSIYNNKGQLIQLLPVLLNQGQLELNLEHEAKGLYNVILSNGVKSYSGKIVFE